MMATLRMSSWRRPLAVGLFVMGWLLLLAPLVLANEGVLAPSAPLVTPLEQETEQASEQVPSPNQDCSVCHIDIVASWRQSTHAQAYNNQDFQSYWQAQGSNPQCLTCHTTNFVPRTGEFSHAGVACASCHGETPISHPPEAVTLPDTATMCGDCHTTTYQEWSLSGHGTPDISCATCHEPHTQQLVAQGNALCMTCHETVPESYSHISHPEQECADCHWHKAQDPQAHFVSGNLLPTGHDGMVETAACTTCHAETDSDWQQFISTGESNLTARLELEAQLSNVEQAGAQASAESSRIVQFGLGLNLGVFIVLSLLFIFWRRSRHDTP